MLKENIRKLMGRREETAGQETSYTSQSADGAIQKMSEGRILQAKGMESTMGRAVEASMSEVTNRCVIHPGSAKSLILSIIGCWTTLRG